MMKIHNFWGELTDISAKEEPLDDRRERMQWRADSGTAGELR